MKSLDRLRPHHTAPHRTAPHRRSRGGGENCTLPLLPKFSLVRTLSPVLDTRAPSRTMAPQPTTVCCPSTSAPLGDLRAYARCLLQHQATKLPHGKCSHNVTSALAVEAHGLDCVATGGGFFLNARTADGRPTCTGGDVFQVWVVVNEAGRLLSRHRTWATPLPVHAAGALKAPAPSLYWVNTSGGTVLPGRHTYHFSVVLKDSQNRALQQLDGRGPLQWVRSPVREWLRYRRCVSGAVPLSSSLKSWDLGVDIVIDRPELPVDEPQCGAVRANASTALVALMNTTHGYSCPPGMCTGNAYARVVKTYGASTRESKGFRHVLKPEGCQLHFYEESEAADCLQGRSILNIGGSMANSVQQGFERLSSRAKTSWWWDFGRTQISNNFQLSPGHTCFVDDQQRASVVTTVFIHHPFRHGLLNVLHPDPKKADGLNKASQFESLMCEHDIVIFESGVHDMALPDRRAHRALQKLCHESVPCTDAELLPKLMNESWRLNQLSSYRTHLAELMGTWRRCAETRAHSGLTPFRPIFKLVTAPNSISSCESEWGYNVEAHYMAVANAAAREVVEAAGFEVFDAFPATAHIHPTWYDMNGKDNQHSDIVSDLTVHMLLNQVCHPSAAASFKLGTSPPRKGPIEGLPRVFQTYSSCSKAWATP